MVHHHQHHFHLIHFHLNKQLSGIYLFIFIKSLALSMIGIFIPIYLLKELNYGLIDVLLFFLAFTFVFMVLSPLIAKICSKIGFKHTILVSMPMFILFYGLLYFLKTMPFLFYIAGLMAGVANAFYWIPFHTHFSKFTDRKHRGEEVGIWHALAVLFSVVGPLSGALILTYIGFGWLFLIVSVLVFVSTIPLFYSREVYTKYKFSLKYIFKESRVKDALTYIGNGVRVMAGGVFWPIFIFLILKTYLKLGVIISVAALFTVFFSWFIGRQSDVYSKRGLIRSGSVLSAIIWFAKMFARTFSQFLSLGILGMLSDTLIEIPFMARVYNKAGKKPIEYIVFRELFVCVGRIIALVFVIGCLFYVKDHLALMFGFGLTGLASLLYLLF